MQHMKKLSSVAIATFFAIVLPAQGQERTSTPIEHLVVIIGENVSFDTMFAAYQPPQGQTVSNLLSRKIINADGSPGPNYREAVQKIPKVRGGYQVDYPEGAPYPALPRPYAKTEKGDGREIDSVLPADLPPGPYPITRYRSYTERTDSNPVHRFFQMWQQVNAGRKDLFVWTSMTSGEGSADKSDPSTSTAQSSEAMGFYNMSKGDLPYFNKLARTYSLADNYHQPIMGGTMSNYFALATGGDVVRYLKDGITAVPPQNQIENPEPVAGTTNWYTRSGYGSGSYTTCADASQPGVGAIRKYLDTLPYPAFNHGNCEAGTYYLVNNYSSPYTYSGVKRPVKPDNYVAPPQTTPTITGALSAKGISWRWYNGGREGSAIKAEEDEYSSDCDPLTFIKQIMETDQKKNLVDEAELFADIKGQMPSVAFVTPPVSSTGHPHWGTPAVFEEYVQTVVEKIQANPALWAKTAILITVDEGGGYYDSGYIQPIDFFGDGTRIPLIAVSPWAHKGRIAHTYYDHVSILKFIERNWGLKPLSHRSRDNLPNPKPGADPYVPGNRPALGDLFELFDFSG
jgi:acid phosphatase